MVQLQIKQSRTTYNSSTSNDPRQNHAEQSSRSILYGTRPNRAEHTNIALLQRQAVQHIARGAPQPTPAVAANHCTAAFHPRTQRGGRLHTHAYCRQPIPPTMQQGIRCSTISSCTTKPAHFHQHRLLVQRVAAQPRQQPATSSSSSSSSSSGPQEGPTTSPTQHTAPPHTQPASPSSSSAADAHTSTSSADPGPLERLLAAAVFLLPLTEGLYRVALLTLQTARDNAWNLSWFASVQRNSLANVVAEGGARAARVETDLVRAGCVVCLLFVCVCVCVCVCALDGHAGAGLFLCTAAPPSPLHPLIVPLIIPPPPTHTHPTHSKQPKPLLSWRSGCCID